MLVAPWEVAEWSTKKSLLGCVGPGSAENHRSKTSNSCTRAVKTGTLSGLKPFMKTLATSSDTVMACSTKPDTVGTESEPKTCSLVPCNEWSGSGSTHTASSETHEMVGELGSLVDLWLHSVPVSPLSDELMTSFFHPSEHAIKGPVLENEDHDVLDGLLGCMGAT